MARDYSSRRNNPPNGNGKRKPAKRPKPAARPTARKKPAPRNSSGGNSRSGGAPRVRSGAPGCVWLLCGLFIGVAGLSIYYIASRPAGHGPQSVSVDLPDNESEAGQASAGSSSPDDSTSKTNAQPSPKKTDPRFSFYKMLPNYKVEVPAGQQAPKPITDNQAPHEAEPASNTPAPDASSATASSSRSSGAQQASGSADADGGYLIQAGAFSTEGDADHRKARLALLGVAAEIVDIRTSSGKTVYRVQSQNFSSRDKAQTMAQRLQSHGIETMVRHAR